MGVYFKKWRSKCAHRRPSKTQVFDPTWLRSKEMGYARFAKFQNFIPGLIEGAGQLLDHHERLNA